ncbi:MAG: hypothetical protein QOD96_5706 [Pseudonocardiales bacterium]|nr:hypothetical protein [Pseudonocardiales bacterium]
MTHPSGIPVFERFFRSVAAMPELATINQFGSVVRAGHIGHSMRIPVGRHPPNGLVPRSRQRSWVGLRMPGMTKSRSNARRSGLVSSGRAVRCSISSICATRTSQSATASGSSYSLVRLPGM